MNMDAWERIVAAWFGLVAGAVVFMLIETWRLVGSPPYPASIIIAILGASFFAASLALFVVSIRGRR